MGIRRSYPSFRLALAIVKRLCIQGVWTEKRFPLSCYEVSGSWSYRLIAVKNSTPDWLPFAPGSSFWVPPPHQKTAAGKVAYMMNMVTSPLKKEEAFSLSSSSGWPCSSFFIPPNGEKVESSMELNIPGELTHFLNPIYSFKHVDDEE
ncbi:hypothetical protein N665_0703s0017 [Sinapis alba]|nr:hypothetical protein N665_0703s0017 [Sinapis alba]